MAARLAAIGSKVECLFQIEINNEPAQLFSTEGEAKAYLNQYRQDNTIFQLKLFRIEIYSL